MRRPPNHNKLVREGIKRAKARGSKFGNPSIMNSAHPVAMAEKTKKATAFNERTASVIVNLRSAGYSSARAIAERMNELGMETRWGKPFTHQTIYRIMRYAKAAKGDEL